MFYIYMRLKHGFDFYLKLKLNICGINHVQKKNEMFFLFLTNVSVTWSTHYNKYICISCIFEVIDEHGLKITCVLLRRFVNNG